MSTNEKKNYPEIGTNYRHYKGGKYNVLTLAKHSEASNVKAIFEKLNSTKLSPEIKFLIKELEKSFEENLVIYKSIHFGSVHARPLQMWFDKVKDKETMLGDDTFRFKEIKDNKD